MKRTAAVAAVFLLAVLLAGCGSLDREAEVVEKAETEYAAQEPEDDIGFAYADSDSLQTETIGDLRIGMTEAELVAAMGQPKTTGNVSMETPDGAVHFSWFYDTGGEPNNDTQLSLADTGDGWFLNEVFLMEDSTVALGSGIGIGSTDAEIRAAYPDAECTTDEVIFNDQPIAYHMYTVDESLRITTADGICKYIEFGPWLQIPPEEAWETVPAPYDLNSDAITIYQWVDGRWQTTTVIDRAAKGICTILTISEPEEAAGETDSVSAWMDFGNGTVVELQGHDRAAVWTCEDGFDPEKADGLTFHMGGLFPDLDEYVEKALADPNAGWEE